MFLNKNGRGIDNAARAHFPLHAHRAANRGVAQEIPAQPVRARVWMVEVCCITTKRRVISGHKSHP